MREPREFAEELWEIFIDGLNYDRGEMCTLFEHKVQEIQREELQEACDKPSDLDHLNSKIRELHEVNLAQTARTIELITEHNKTLDKLEQLKSEVKELHEVDIARATYITRLIAERDAALEDNK